MEVLAAAPEEKGRDEMTRLEIRGGILGTDCGFCYAEENMRKRVFALVLC